MQSRLPASSKILFISDVHLGALTTEKNRQLETELIGVIDYAEQENYQIALLGDLFDYWIEYPNMTPSLGEKLLQRFREFHQQSPASLYITGNHDNWTLGHFADCGFDVEPDYRILHIENWKVLLVHGDATGESPENFNRPLFHRIIRSETFLKWYRRLLPPKLGLSVMKNFSKISRLTGDDKSDPTELDRWARKMLKDDDIDFILCGHDHVPRKFQHDYGTYINLGTFQYNRTFAAYNNRHFQLVNWNNRKKKIEPFEPQQLNYE